MATRIYNPKIEAKGGILLPTGAGEGKVATSDASGNISWASKSIIVEKAFTFGDGVAVPNEILGGWKIELGEGETKKITKVIYKTFSGTIKVAVKRGSAGSTEISAYKELALTSSFETTTSTQALEAGDYVTVTTSAGSSAKGLSVTIFIQVN